MSMSLTDATIWGGPENLASICSRRRSSAISHGRETLSRPAAISSSTACACGCSGVIIAALAFATLATGLLEIAVPLELRQLHASPNEIGLTLAMFGFGMFAFEWVWGVVADRVGYGAPLVASQLLYGAFIVLLSRVQSIPLIAVGYLLASGMMVAVGPIARSYLGTTLHARLRATGLGLRAFQWVI